MGVSGSSTAEVITPEAAVAPQDGAAPDGAPAESEAPLTVIEARPGWHFVDLRELWRYRELLFFLAWRDVKVRYKQTVLGAAWALVQPLATMGAFALFLGRVASAPDAAMPYPLFVFTGLLPWTFFAAAVASAGNSVVTNQALVTKVYFPRLLVPVSALGAPVLDFAVSCLLLLALMAFYGVAPGWGLLVAPAVVLVLAAFALGLGLVLAALTVSYRDFRALVPLLLQLWMFMTPAIYLQQDLSIFGPRQQAVLPLNPLHGVVVNFRAATAGGPFEWGSLGVTACWALAALVGGGLYFRRVERGFADVI
jgi:lipopolysaccharide transport system permease protein